MASPFPGMDPYIEACGLWGDFHTALITEIRKRLAAAVAGKYIVRLGQRNYVVLEESEEKRERRFYPDVNVTSPQAPTRTASAVAEPMADAESVSLRAFVAAEHRETFIDVYAADEPERYLVTCIELLSPANKRPKTTGWKQYLRKRKGLLLGRANFVEIDLLRGGTRMPMLDPWPTSPYTFLVSRVWRAPDCRVWPVHFRKPMPLLRVPLESPDPDVEIDLKPLINEITQEGGYERDIDYTRPLTPPLADDDAAWLAEQLRQAPGHGPGVASGNS
jgi:hypothetical protein